MLKSIVVDCLHQVMKKNRSRKLMPSAVVSEARNANSPLHKYFEWNDSKAAQAHRLWQARQLISEIEIVSDDRYETAPVYISLSIDRKDGGYRAISDVLSNATLRKEMLSTALGELKAMQDRYNRLAELAGVFEAVKQVEKKHHGKKSKSPLAG